MENKEWVSCTDRLPPEGELVIVTVLEHRIEFYSKVENGQWLHEYGDGISISAPTHWRSIVADAPVDNGWIKCSDRLPEEGEAVIFVTKHWAMHVGTYHLNDDCDFSDGEITHWRPLPPLPTGPLDH